MKIDFKLNNHSSWSRNRQRSKIQQTNPSLTEVNYRKDTEIQKFMNLTNATAHMKFQLRRNWKMWYIVKNQSSGLNVRKHSQSFSPKTAQVAHLCGQGFIRTGIFKDPEKCKGLQQNWTYTQNPVKCNHRAAFPVLTLHFCAHCKMCHHQAKDCAIVWIHEGAALLYSDSPVLCHFPCGYCNSTPHTTRMCTLHHEFSKDC